MALRNKASGSSGVDAIVANGKRASAMISRPTPPPAFVPLLLARCSREPTGRPPRRPSERAMRCGGASQGGRRSRRGRRRGGAACAGGRSMRQGALGKWPLATAVRREGRQRGHESWGSGEPPPPRAAHQRAFSPRPSYLPLRQPRRGRRAAASLLYRAPMAQAPVRWKRPRSSRGRARGAPWSGGSASAEAALAVHSGGHLCVADTHPPWPQS